MTFLRTWHYFRLCFSFSCSSYDFKLSYTLNYYSFSQNFLLKTKTGKLVVGKQARFTVKTTNSEKAIYFLSLMSCSISLTCSSHVNVLFFLILLGKKFCSRKWWGGVLAPPFLYGPDKWLWVNASREFLLSGITYARNLR